MFFLYTLTCCTGCAESNNRDTSVSGDGDGSASSSMNWFYFDDEGNLTEIENPSMIPAVEFKPWTEATAVLDSGFSGQEPVLLVNKKGLVSPDMLIPDTPVLETESDALHPATADGIFPSAEKLSSGTSVALLTENGKTFIRFYRNSVFSGNTSLQPVSLYSCEDVSPFGIGDAVYAADFGAKENSQCVSLNYTGDPGEPWIAAFKSSLDKGGGFLFEYLALSSLPVSSGFKSRVVSAGDFQASIEKSTKKPVPEPFEDFLALVPSSYGVSLKISGKDFPASCTFVSGGDKSRIFEGCGFLTDDTVATLFSDGTLYLASRNGNSRLRTIRLPVLNRGYIYTSFVVSGHKILAGWEERRFFETGRSGILAVSLNTDLPAN